LIGGWVGGWSGGVARGWEESGEGKEVVLLREEEKEEKGKEGFGEREGLDERTTVSTAWMVVDRAPAMARRDSGQTEAFEGAE